MNAVNETMYREIRQVLDDARVDQNIRVIIITGSIYRKGDQEKQAFCAGADLKEHASGKRDKIQKKKYIELAHRTTHQLYEFPKPTIAAVNGPGRGAGFELALNCDFILMADTATLAFSETGLGTFVGGGVTAHLTNIIGLMKAKELVYTGKILDGPEAVNSGIALKSMPVAELIPASRKLAQILAEKAPLSLQLAKQGLQQGRLLDNKTILRFETDSILSCMETEDWLEGIQAFIQKRKPDFKGR